MMRLLNSKNEKVPKKRSITLSLDNEILSEIRMSALDSQQSINLKINNILSKYAYFDIYTEQESCMTIPGKDIIPSMMDLVEENRLKDEYKTIILDAIPSDLLQKKIHLNLDTCIKYIFEGECIYGGSYQSFSHYKDNEGYVCLDFRHVYPPKWSRVIGSAFAELLETYLGYASTLNVLSDGLILKLTDKNVPLSDS
jgi:hypothetical protein